MQMRCPSCGYRYLNDASFCIVCGAALRPIAHEPSARPTGATGPTIRLGQQFSLPAGAASAPARAADRTVAQTSPWRGASKPLIALLFAVVFMIGLAEYLTSRGAPGLGMWLVGLVTGGALLAQQAWVNGDLWRGARGMLVWGGLTWLLATDLAVPWALLLILVWCALQPRWYRHSA